VCVRARALSHAALTFGKSGYSLTIRRYKPSDVPTHPCLRLIANSEQVNSLCHVHIEHTGRWVLRLLLVDSFVLASEFGAKILAWRLRRRLITMEKVLPYDPGKHANAAVLSQTYGLPFSRTDYII
jgi:hypothetical protein